MRSDPASHRLLFLLPAGSSVDSGCHRPSPEGCRLRVEFPLVEITGPSRVAVFEHAARLIRLACRGRRLSISAMLAGPGGPNDAWSIIIGADVAFSPTSIDPHFPKEARPPPNLVLLA